VGKRRDAEVLLDCAVPPINAMFWKKPPGSLRRVTQPETPQARSAPRMQVAVDDAALDTVAGLLKSFGEHAFDTDSVTAADTRAECDGWAQRIAVGEGKKGEDELSFKRDWSGVRRYFTAQRSHEREYVGRSLGNLREAVHAFARCLTSTVSEDRAADERVGAQLGRLVGAFQGNDSEAIRKEAEAIVSVVRQVMDERS
jgi:diguanylate cyclase